MNYFRYKQFNKDVITVAVGYYLRYALSYRDISEILRERGVNVHHSTVYRWDQEYAPILYQIWKKKHKKAYYKWRIDETYIKIKGKWSYLYRAIDAEGHTLDIWSEKRSVKPEPMPPFISSTPLTSRVAIPAIFSITSSSN